MQITRKSVCRYIRNSAPFCHSLAYLSDPGRHARCLPSTMCWMLASNVLMSNLDIFLFPTGPAHLTRPPTYLISRVPREGLALQLPYFVVWVGHTHLKIFQTMQKHSHIKKLKKFAWVTIFCLTTHFWGVGGPKADQFFRNIPECVVHYFSVL